MVTSRQCFAKWGDPNTREASVPYPTDGGMYMWDEATQSWVAVTV